MFMVQTQRNLLHVFASQVFTVTLGQHLHKFSRNRSVKVTRHLMSSRSTEVKVKGQRLVLLLWGVLGSRPCTGLGEAIPHGNFLGRLFIVFIFIIIISVIMKRPSSIAARTGATHRRSFWHFWRLWSIHAGEFKWHALLAWDEDSSCLGPIQAIYWKICCWSSGTNWWLRGFLRWWLSGRSWRGSFVRFDTIVLYLTVAQLLLEGQLVWHVDLDEFCFKSIETLSCWKTYR